MKYLPKFPQRSLMSQGVLYRPLQDVEVYVEDEDSETFYGELLSRLVAPDIRICRVIPLGGRTNVLKECYTYADSHPVLFIIDGDLPWVSGQESLSHPNLFVNPCYCVENYLICEHAMTEVAYENSGKQPKDTIQKMIAWPSMVAEIKDILVALFCEFAVAHQLESGLKTTSYGFTSVCTQKNGGPIFDRAKADALQKEIREKIQAKTEPALYRSALETVRCRVAALNDPLDAVSGKDFLLPLVMFTIRRVAHGKVELNSLPLRLARHCLLEKLEPLRNELRRVATKTTKMPNSNLYETDDSHGCAFSATGFGGAVRETVRSKRRKQSKSHKARRGRVFRSRP